MYKISTRMVMVSNAGFLPPKYPPTKFHILLVFKGQAQMHGCAGVTTPALACLLLQKISLRPSSSLVEKGEKYRLAKRGSLAIFYFFIFFGFTRFTRKQATKTYVSSTSFTLCINLSDMYFC